MASDGGPTRVSVSGLAHGSQAPVISKVSAVGGKSLPPGGKQAAAPQRPAPAREASVPDLRALIASLNKFLNDSGRPKQFRVAGAPGNPTIEEVNPANGDVVGEFAASEFPALARSLGASGILFNGHA